MGQPHIRFIVLFPTSLTPVDYMKRSMTCIDLANLSNQTCRACMLFFRMLRYKLIQYQDMHAVMTVATNHHCMTFHSAGSQNGVKLSKSLVELDTEFNINFNMSITTSEGFSNI